MTVVTMEAAIFVPRSLVKIPLQFSGVGHDLFIFDLH